MVLGLRYLCTQRALGHRATNCLPVCRYTHKDNLFKCSLEKMQIIFRHLRWYCLSHCYCVLRWWTVCACTTPLTSVTCHWLRLCPRPMTWFHIISVVHFSTALKSTDACSNWTHIKLIHWGFKIRTAPLPPPQNYVVVNKSINFDYGAVFCKVS